MPFNDARKLISKFVLSLHSVSHGSRIKVTKKREGCSATYIDQE